MPFVLWQSVWDQCHAEKADGTAWWISLVILLQRQPQNMTI